MADKTYRMTVTLSDGSTVDAGTFVAPQGPQGIQGPSGALPDWVDATASTVLTDGVYIIGYEDKVGLVYISDGINYGFEMGIVYNKYSTSKNIMIYIGTITNGKFTNINQTEINYTNGNITLESYPLSIDNYKYIKLL